MSFLKNLLTSFLGVFLALTVMLLITLGIAFAMSNDEAVEVKENAVLELNLKGSVVDYVPNEKEPLEELLGLDEEKIGFNQIIEAIDKATFDTKIKGLSIRAISSDMGWAQLTALRKKIQEFKKAGKFVRAFADTYTQKEYYIASVADQVYLSPMGYVELKGLTSEVVYLKDFQDKYGVKMEVIRHGKYKSAVEPFLANKMSDENRSQISELLNSIWSTIGADIAESRGVDIEIIVNALLGKNSDLSLRANLVDGLIYEDTYNKYFEEDLKSKDVQFVSIKDYLTANTTIETEEPNIAVIYAQGDIIYGEGNKDFIGQLSMVKAIDDAAADENIKGIVLRINSPGGSALASDLIWRAVFNAKSKKPVVVSMGDVAASGGYYIACLADRIFAEPTTITGSIGVFGILPNATQFSNYIGVQSETVSTHQNGAHYSVLQPISPQFKSATQQGIENIYDMFVKKVADGRHMAKDQVEFVAQGRVWTGEMALEVGLVDEIGGLQQAIDYLAKKAKITKVSVLSLPEYDSDYKSILGGNPLMNLWTNDHVAIKEFNKLTKIESVLKLKGAQTRIPFEMNIE